MQSDRCCFNIAAQVVSRQLEIQAEVVCETDLNWEEIVDADGENIWVKSASAGIEEFKVKRI